jgi:hypothetical protein
MTALAAGAVSIIDSAIVIPAETVARRLGPKQRGIRVKVTEQ